MYIGLSVTVVCLSLWSVVADTWCCLYLSSHLGAFLVVWDLGNALLPCYPHWLCRCEPALQPILFYFGLCSHD